MKLHRKGAWRIYAVTFLLSCLFLFLTGGGVYTLVVVGIGDPSGWAIMLAPFMGAIAIFWIQTKVLLWIEVSGGQFRMRNFWSRPVSFPLSVVDKVDSGEIPWGPEFLKIQFKTGEPLLLDSSFSDNLVEFAGALGAARDPGRRL